jgi:hypothetical protein
MHRREFMKIGAGSAMLGSAATLGGRASGSETAARAEATPAVFASYTAQDHRNRLESIRFCESAIRGCLRKHLVTDYLPGQACYNLGEYPSTEPWDVDEYDEQELDRLRDHGIKLIQVFDDWNDALRLFGGDKYTAVNAEGYRRFIEMAHRRGMKVLTYVSSCFLERAHPEFQPVWSREGDYLVVGYWDMARCAPASAGWRAFLLPRLVRVMDEYGADGLYVDGGYLANRHPAKQQMTPTADEVLAFPETPDHDGAFTDLLALIYGEVKRRGGILKLHVNAAEQPESSGLRVYDYLWVGEGVAEADPLRETVKDYPPYVVPCLDMSFTAIESENEPYLHAIPYMQFPVLMGGKTFTGQRGTVPGVTYQDDFWTRRCREAWQQYQADPSGLHTYSSWDEVPGSPTTRAVHKRWLHQYRALVEEGTWVWLEIADSDLFLEPLPAGIVASAFANTDVYLVLANFTRETATVATRDNYVPLDRPAESGGAAWTLPGRSLQILRLNRSTTG